MTASMSRRRPRTQSFRELEQHWNTASGTMAGPGWCWNPLNAEGEPEKLVVVNRNITERKRAEADFRSVVEDAPYGIYRASITGRFLQVNPALQKMLGYEHEQELLRKDLAKDIFRHNGEYQRLTELLNRSKEIKDIEMERNKQDGTSITVRCSGYSIYDENGFPACFEVFAEDVTEKRVLERQLRMAQKMEAIGRLFGRDRARLQQSSRRNHRV